MKPIEQVRLVFGLLQEVHANAQAEANHIEGAYQTLDRMLRMGEEERVEALAAVLRTADLLRILQSLLIGSANPRAQQIPADEHRERLRQAYGEMGCDDGEEEEPWRSE